MTRKLFSLILMSFLVVVTANLTLLADDIVPGSEQRITTHNDAEILSGEPDYYAIEGDTVVWIDQRNGYTNQYVYGVDLTDINLDEFLIDDEGGYISKIALANSMAFYPITPSTPEQDYYFLRLADISNPASINYYDIDPNGADGYFQDLDMSGSLIAFSTYNDTTGECRLIAADISDPTTIVQHIIFSTSSYGIYDLTLDGNYLCWINYYSENPIQVADITDLANPVIQTLPLDGDDVYMNDLDSSGDWLVAQGQLGWDSPGGLFAIKKYWDVENFTIELVWETQDDATEALYPQIDQDKLIWIFHDYGYGGGGYAGEGDVEFYSLYQANFLPTGPGPASELLKTTESDPEFLRGATLSGDTIVLAYGDDLLYSAELEMGCGDWGYLPADLNEDCMVNLLDFAKFAESWLYCTDPTKPGCIFGVFNHN